MVDFRLIHGKKTDAIIRFTYVVPNSQATIANIFNTPIVLISFPRKVKVMKKNIHIITTGGTIVSKPSNSLGAKPSLSGEDLIQMIPKAHSLAELTVHNFTKIPSTEMTIEVMYQLAQEIEHMLTNEDVDGIVVTHGTDTMEETAYLHDLVLKNDKPIVFTGAMRTAASLSADGPMNLLQAIMVASHPNSKNYPPLIVMNDEIHLARYSMKFHATSSSSFQSLDCGPVGIIREEKIHYFYEAMQQKQIRPDDRLKAQVEIIKVAAGSSDLFLQTAIEHKLDGIIIEGTGAGHVPPAWVTAIEKAIQEGITIIMVPRSPAGYPLHQTYGIRGGEIHLQELGVLFGHSNAQKTRIFLTLALSAGWKKEEIKKFFQEK
ncbi:asparaginase [Virgibacillus sp. W0430]|uniref:asparaginase n=1 Tax=Virgibacillus sp. W0430 TaxID=3391580 RepID=UPI003F485AA5